MAFGLIVAIHRGRDERDPQTCGKPVFLEIARGSMAYRLGAEVRNALPSEHSLRYGALSGESGAATPSRQHRGLDRCRHPGVLRRDPLPPGTSELEEPSAAFARLRLEPDAASHRRARGAAGLDSGRLRLDHLS